MVLFYSVDPIWHTLSICGLLFFICGFFSSLDFPVHEACIVSHNGISGLIFFYLSLLISIGYSRKTSTLSCTKSVMGVVSITLNALASEPRVKCTAVRKLLRNSPVRGNSSFAASRSFCNSSVLSLLPPGIRAKLFNKKRYAEKAEMKRTYVGDISIRVAAPCSLT